MALISVSNLVLSLGDRRLLDGANLTVDQGQRIGMVGVNGCGKSTLLRLIAGIETHRPDSGQVAIARGAVAGYLTQDPVLDPQRTLRDEAASALAHLYKLHEDLNVISHDMATAEGDALDKLLKRYEDTEHRIQALGGFAVDHQIDATLHGLGLTDEFFGVKVKDLSGGQKGRLALAKLLLSSPDILLLDEPTNHLDIAGCEWLEGYLNQTSAAVLLVSHDRWLLDRVVEKIYELEGGKLVEYPGNYRAFREQRVLRRLSQQRVYEKQQERIKHEQAFIDRYRAGQRAAQAQGREKRLERYKRDDTIERPMELNEVSIRVRPASRCGDLVITADAVSKGYENKPLFRNVSAVVKRGSKVGIIGPNGAGKSTLVACMLGLTPPDSGTVRVGASVDIGHYRQTHEHLPADQSIVDYLRKYVPSETEQEARDLAGAFLFSGRDQDKRLNSLSGGERSRTVLAGLIVSGHNVLVLDEPTNHLDIPSSERLEDALKQFTTPATGYGENQTSEGTLILITHDRMLLENLVDQLFILDGAGNVRHFLGTYSEYAALQHAQTQAAKPASGDRDGKSRDDKDRKKDKDREREKVKPTQSTRPSGAGKSSGKSGHGPLSRLSQEALEQKIVTVESELAKLDGELADPQVYRDGAKVKRLQDRREILSRELSPLEEEWARRAQE